MILALGCKTVFAVEIASVRNVQAHCFEHGVALCQNIHVGFESVLRKEFALFFKFLYIVDAIEHVLLGDVVF